jgi:hypothetical protein
MPTVTDQRLERVADQWLRLPNARGIPVEVCAGPERTPTVHFGA